MHSSGKSLQNLLSVVPEDVNIQRNEILALVSQLRSSCRGMENDLLDLTGDSNASASLRLATTSDETEVIQLIWECLKVVVRQWSEDTEVISVSILISMTKCFSDPVFNKSNLLGCYGLLKFQL